LKNNILGHAIAIASEAFKDKVDRGGAPYILHCLHVMNAVSSYGYDVMSAAVLHDILEDTDWKESDLIREGFSFDIISLINILTHKENESYDSYIRRVALDERTKAIKKADLEHNSQITRMKGLTQKDFERLQKYFTAYKYLS
jgi:(p)ppGpp synthase/HD superfamily hydrolase